MAIGPATSFGEYLDTVDQGLAIHAGFLVGHSAIRRVVMGDAAVGERATPVQLEAMTRLLGDSLKAGGLGLSSGRTPVHQDMEGDCVPSFHASDEELFALCRTVRAHPGTTLEFAPSLAEFEATGELMIEMSLVAGRPINWNVLIVNAQRPDDYLRQLALSDLAALRGARVVPLSVPHPMEFFVDFVSPFYFGGLPGFGKVMTLPLPERKRALADPAQREPIKRAIAEALKGPLADYSDFARMEIVRTFFRFAFLCRGIMVPQSSGMRARRRPLTPRNCVSFDSTVPIGMSVLTLTGIFRSSSVSQR